MHIMLNKMHSPKHFILFTITCLYIQVQLLSFISFAVLLSFSLCNPKHSLFTICHFSHRSFRYYFGVTNAKGVERGVGPGRDVRMSESQTFRPSTIEPSSTINKNKRGCSMYDSITLYLQFALFPKK